MGMKPSSSPPLPPAVAGKSGTKVMTAGELALPFIGCSKQKRPCTSSPKKHSGVGPDAKGTGELVQRYENRRAGPGPQRLRHTRTVPHLD